jgi:hypothetical protein
MAGFENYAEEAEQLEIEIARKGVALNIDWTDSVQVRQLARDALDCHLTPVNYPPDTPEEHARLELFGLIQLMLTVMRESAGENIHTHGGTVWKSLAHALWAEHALRAENPQV